MKILVEKEFWVDAPCVTFFDTDMAVRVEGVTRVRIGGRTDNLVSLRFYRASDVLGVVTIPVVEAISLVAKLESLGVDINGDLDVPEVA